MGERFEGWKRESALEDALTNLLDLIDESVLVRSELGSTLRHVAALEDALAAACEALSLEED